VQARRAQNIAEYLFGDENGELIADVNMQELDQIYNGYMQVLIN